jgi:hypothetical protein
MRTLTTPNVFTRAIAATLLGASAIAVSLPAAARTPFDGLWSVLIVTESGDCDRGYRYPVAIVNGSVQHAPNEGDQSFVIAGRVATGGAVRVSVRRGEQYAEGSGRLTPSTGEGRWRSPSGGCSGYWQAERRG